MSQSALGRWLVRPATHSPYNRHDLSTMEPPLGLTISTTLSSPDALALAMSSPFSFLPALGSPRCLLVFSLSLTIETFPLRM